MLIARLIADPATLSANLDAAKHEMATEGLRVALAEMSDFCSDVLELSLPEGDPAVLQGILDRYFQPSDLLVAERPFAVPQLLVSDMDSTMITAECIDELADFAGIKPQIAAITERAMQGELNFESALRERVLLLRDLPEDAIRQCLETRIAPMPGAKTLIATLTSLGCRTVLVTGGFHQFADPVAAMLGFERVVGNRLGLAGGMLTGDLVGPVVDSAVKKAVLLEEMAALGDGAISLAAGDGANDIPMIEAATFGIAYRAKARARAAADGWVDKGDLTAILDLLGIARTEWVRG